MRALSFVAAAIAVVLALGCSNRYAALCDHEFACFQEEDSTLGASGSNSAQTCSAELAVEDDAATDACFDCLINLPCDIVNDCAFRKQCHEARLECAAVCN